MNDGMGVDEDAQKLADFVRFRAFFEGKTPQICLPAGGRGIWAGAAGGAISRGLGPRLSEWGGDDFLIEVQRTPSGPNSVALRMAGAMGVCRE